MESNNSSNRIGIIYGIDPDTIMLTDKFVGHLINNEEFCTACEELEQKVKCDECRRDLKSYSNYIYYFEQVGKNVPQFIDDPMQYLPKNIPPIDYLLVIGIHEDLLSGLPELLKDSEIKAVIVPIEDPKWVPAGLQKQVLEAFEDVGIQAAFPKPFCSLNVKEDEYNKVGFNLTHEHNYIKQFVKYFQIGKPIVSIKLDKTGKAIEDVEVVRSAPCGSTYYILQQLKGKYLENGKAGRKSLNERISSAHHAYPCNASMDQDPILKDSILHVGGYLIRRAIRKDLNLDQEEGPKLKYIIK